MNDNHKANASKRLARLVAVQALYQASFEQEPLPAIITRLMEETSASLNDTDATGEKIKGIPDRELLTKIVDGVTQNTENLTEMLKGALDSKFSSERMEVLLRQILLAGAFELHHHPDIDANIIISDYIDVTRAFYAAKEPGLVNAVLDKLGKILRA